MSTPGLSAREFSRILLIKPSAVGDVIHTLPVLAKLRRRYPEARIDWLLTPENAELVRGHPALSNVVLFSRREFRQKGKLLTAVARAAMTLGTLRRGRYDLVIDLHGQMRSAIFALATGAKMRIGFGRPIRRSATVFQGKRLGNVPTHGWAGAREGAWLAYTDRIPIPTLEVHAVDRYLWVGKMLGLDDGVPEFLLPGQPDAEARATELMEVTGDALKRMALLAPGAMWETKLWTPEGFTEVANGLGQQGFAVLLIGSEQEVERNREIAAGAPNVIDLTGVTTLGDMVALVRRAAVVVTNDSGAMHAAAALGRPVVGVFGPTNPVQVGPYGQPEAVVRLDLACSPCNFRRLSQCPNGHACMRELPPSLVMERVREILAEQAGNA